MALSLDDLLKVDDYNIYVELLAFLRDQPDVNVLLDIMSKYQQINGPKKVLHDIYRTLCHCTSLSKNLEQLTTCIELFESCLEHDKLADVKFKYLFGHIIYIICYEHHIASIMLNIDNLKELAQKCTTNSEQLWQSIISKPVFSELVIATLRNSRKHYATGDILVKTTNELIIPSSLILLAEQDNQNIDLRSCNYQCQQEKYTGDIKNKYYAAHQMVNKTTYRRFRFLYKDFLSSQSRKSAYKYMQT